MFDAICPTKFLELSPELGSPVRSNDRWTSIVVEPTCKMFEDGGRGGVPEVLDKAVSREPVDQNNPLFPNGLEEIRGHASMMQSFI